MRPVPTRAPHLSSTNTDAELGGAALLYPEAEFESTKGLSSELGLIAQTMQTQHERLVPSLSAEDPSSGPGLADPPGS